MTSLVVWTTLKENLAKVSVHFRITPAAAKSRILILIEEYCIEHDIIDEVEKNITEETAEVLRLKLEFEERRLTREEVQRACDAEKALQDARFEETQKAQEEALRGRFKTG